jgi:hypothetical protein
VVNGGVTGEGATTTATAMNVKNVGQKNGAVGAKAVAPTSAESASHMEMRAAVMALVMCALSIAEHVFLLICVIYPLLDTSLDYSTIIYLYWAADFSICLKHSVNIFIFYGFNKNFKKVFDKYFKRC